MIQTEGFIKPQTLSRLPKRDKFFPLKCQWECFLIKATFQTRRWNTKNFPFSISWNKQETSPRVRKFYLWTTGYMRFGARLYASSTEHTCLFPCHDSILLELKEYNRTLNTGRSKQCRIKHGKLICRLWLHRDFHAVFLLVWYGHLIRQIQTIVGIS